MGTATALAQDGYDPGYRGYLPPAAPYPSGYEQPGRPYGDDYGYAPVRPSNPYAGDEPLDARRYDPPVGYGYAPVQPSRYYGGGYPPVPSGYSRPGAYDPEPIPPPGPAGGYAGPSPVVGLSGQLVYQVDDFLRYFVPTARVVPQGRQFLTDASILRDAAARLQQMASTGAPPAALADQFGVVAATWQRFESRMERVAKGRMGPNIAKILQMGGTVEQIQGLLP